MHRPRRRSPWAAVACAAWRREGRAIAPPCRRAIAAATCRWQLRPWHIPIETRVRPLTVFRSADIAIAASSCAAVSSSQRQTTVSGVGELVDARAQRAYSRCNARRNASFRRAGARRGRPRRRPRRGESIEVERRAQRGDTSLVDRDVGAVHAGAVSGGGDAVDARPQPLVPDDDRATEVLVVR